MTNATLIHENQPVLMRGTWEGARAAVILLHGRGATAESILALADELLERDSPVVTLAPQARGFQWYPHRFHRPLAENEPYLTSALNTVAGLIAHAAEHGIAAEKLFIGGFSQGACLALESAARHPQRFGGVFALSGALIGPLGTPHPAHGNFAGTPIFLGCSDVDEHIPLPYVEESATALAGLGAAVDKRIYPGMGHTVNEDEIEAVRAMLLPLVT